MFSRVRGHAMWREARAQKERVKGSHQEKWFGIAYEKNQLSGFQGIKFPWKPTLSGSIEYHGPPRSGHLSFP